MLSHFKSTAVNSLIYTFGNLSTKIVGLILIPIYTKHLTVADYGILGLSEVTQYAIFVLFGYQLFMAFFRWYWDPAYRESQKSMFYTIMVFLTISSIAICFIFCPFSKYFSSVLFNNTNYTYLIELIIISSALQVITFNPGILMRLQEKAFIYMITSVVRLLVNLILTIVFIVGFHRGVSGIFEAQIIGSFVYMILIMPYIIKNIEFKFDFRLLKAMLIFSAPTIISGISAIIISLSDRYFLNFTRGLDSTGLYSFGYKLANTVNILIAASISLAVTPLVYKMLGDKDNLRFYSKIMTYSVYVITFFSLFFAIFGKEIVKVLASNTNYWPSFNVIPFICLAIIFSNMRDTTMNGLNIQKKTKIIASVLVISSLLNVFLNYLLVSPLGYYGAALALLTTNVITFFLMFYYSQKYYPIDFEIKKLFQIIFVYIIFAGIAFLFNNYNIYIRLIIKSFLILAFPVVLYYLKFYEKIELERLKGFWEKWKRPQKLLKNIKEIKTN